jgi:hypothetical protein
MSRALLKSFGTRSRASDSNVTKRPSALIDEPKLSPLAAPPPIVRLMSTVLRVRRSKTKRSALPFVSLATRLVAYDWKTTQRPSGVIDPGQLNPLASAPLVETLARITCPVWRSLMNTSSTSFVSLATRSVESDANST